MRRALPWWGVLALAAAAGGCEGQFDLVLEDEDIGQFRFVDCGSVQLASWDEGETTISVFRNHETSRVRFRGSQMLVIESDGSAGVGGAVRSFRHVEAIDSRAELRIGDTKHSELVVSAIRSPLSMIVEKRRELCEVSLESSEFNGGGISSVGSDDLLCERLVIEADADSPFLVRYSSRIDLDQRFAVDATLDGGQGDVCGYVPKLTARVTAGRLNAHCRSRFREVDLELDGSTASVCVDDSLRAVLRNGSKLTIMCDPEEVQLDLDETSTSTTARRG